MQITLEIRDDYINEFMSFLKLVDSGKIKIKNRVKMEKNILNLSNKAKKFLDNLTLEDIKEIKREIAELKNK